MKYYPYLAKVHKYHERGGSSSQPMILTNPFPPYHQQMVAQNMDVIHITDCKGVLHPMPTS